MTAQPQQWWIRAVERVGVGSVMAMLVLYLGWGTLDKMAGVINANTAAIDKLNTTLSVQATTMASLSLEVRGLANRVDDLEEMSCVTRAKGSR